MATGQLILVVEDDADSCAALVEMLEGVGYQAVTAKDGVEALALLKTTAAPDAIITDLDMPRMGGAALCDACAASPALERIPRIVTTGLASADGCKADLFVSKPINPELLLRSLERLITLRA